MCTPTGCVLCSRLVGDQERKNQRCELSCGGMEGGAGGGKGVCSVLLLRRGVEPACCSDP